MGWRRIAPALACLALCTQAQAWELSGSKTLTAVTREQTSMVLGTVRTGDYAWLEHSLLFLYKQPQDFGAKLWNGVYYRFTPDGQGLVGLPQAVDLNLISAPPDDLNTPPYGASERTDMPAASRWIERLLLR